MADEKIQLALGDLLRSVTNEFAVALTLVKRSHPNVLVRSVKLKLGQSPEDAPEVEEGPPLLLPDRYPEAEKGWQLELELGERASANLQGRPLVTSPSVDVPTAFDVFARESISILKGISIRWADFFAEFDILEIWQLAELDASLLQSMTAQSRSLLPREFRQKALLLKTPLPTLPDSAAKEMPIYELLHLPVSSLQEKLGSRLVSLTETRDLIDILDVLNLVIDSAVLRKVSLAELLKRR